MKRNTAVLTLALVLCLRTGSSLPSGGQIKAVLIAGSNGYDNYRHQVSLNGYDNDRHQADICHAYHILHENGVPDENIIVMMYDDVANSTENPNPGVIINIPGGPNVYSGVPKDYTGQEVNKKNFFHVLTGNKAAMKGIGTGRVLESGPQDHLFINFVDHGGPGVLLLPEEEIMASEFIKVLQDMADSSRYAKMFLYIEACESGSMFDNLLPDDLNIFVMTAADPHESSYACFYDEKLQTYLGDVFSVKWMQDSENVDLRSESVNHQFQKVRSETNTSHVEEYGDIDIGNTKMNEVIGYREKPSQHYPLNIEDAVASHHVPVAILGQRIRTSKSLHEKESLKKKLHSMLEGRKRMEEFFLSLISHAIPTSQNQLFEETVMKRPSLTKNNVACYEKTLTQVTKECFSISQNPFAASHLHKVINLCNIIPEAILIEIVSTICQKKHRLHGIV